MNNEYSIESEIKVIVPQQTFIFYRDSPVFNLLHIHYLVFEFIDGVLLVHVLHLLDELLR
jgi:hypothetical protein